MEKIFEFFYKNYAEIKKDFYLFTTKANGMSILWHKPSLGVFKLDSAHTKFFDELLKIKNPQNLRKVLTKTKVVAENVMVEMEKLLYHKKTIYPNGAELRRLNLLVSQQCNLRCIYCYAKEGTYGNPSMMSIETAEKIISFFVNFFPVIRSVQFFGGEPLLNMECIEYVVQRVNQFALSGKIREPANFVIVSSLAVSNDIIQRLINVLIKEEKLRIIVSCDGPARIHNTLRPYRNGKSSFRTVLRNIEALMPYGQPSSVEVTYTKRHYLAGLSIADIQDYFLKRFGLTNVIIVPVISKDITLSLSKHRMVVSQFERLHEIVAAFKNINAGEKKNVHQWLQILGKQILSTPPSQLFCDFGVSNFTITTDGDIYPCQLLVGLNEFKIGNVYRNYAETYDALLKSIDTYRKISLKDQHKHCVSCYLQFYCTGCPASEYLLKGRFISPSIFEACAKRKQLIKELLIAYAVKSNQDKK